MLYELLTGRRPYHASRRPMHEVLRAICEEEPTAPSTAATFGGAPAGQPARSSRLKQRLQGDLDNIVLKALSKEPLRRYTSAEKFSEDIARHLSRLPVSARKPTLRYRTSKYIRRNFFGVAAAAAGFLALTGGLAAVTWEARRARAGEAEARRQAQEAATQKTRAEAQQRIADERGKEAAGQRAVADQRAGEATARRIEAEARTREAQAQRERAERRFNDVRKLATSPFDIHDAVKALPAPSRRAT